MDSRQANKSNLISLPGGAVNLEKDPDRKRRLLDVSEVAIWLGVSKGWVRDHASGRRQPRLRAVKLGPEQGKGLWKFREEDIQNFITARISA